MKLTNTLIAPVVRQAVVQSVVTRRPDENSGGNDQVSLSSEALDLARNDIDIRGVHSGIYGTPPIGDRIGQRYRELGEEGFLNTAAPDHYTAEEAERFQKTLQYLVDIQKLRDVEVKFDENPFWGLGRDALVSIEEDEQYYSEAERYAAGRAKDAVDNLFFTRLIEHSTSTGDHRPVLKGYLEYLDNLTPVERLNYPDDERDKVAARLARAENESGSLPKDFSLWQYINWDPKGRLNLESMLDPSITEPAAPGAAGPADDQGSSRLR